MSSLNLDRLVRQLAIAVDVPFRNNNCRGLLQTCFEGYFLKGLLFERSGRRNSLYFWRVLLPTFHPAPNLSLNFSERLNGRGTIDGSGPEIVAQAARCVMDTPNLSTWLRSATSPSEFLAAYAGRLAGPLYPPWTCVFDLAACAALVGDGATATRLIDEILRRTRGEPRDVAVYGYATELVHTLQDRDGLDRLLARIAVEQSRG